MIQSDVCYQWQKNELDLKQAQKKENKVLIEVLFQVMMIVLKKCKLLNEKRLYIIFKLEKNSDVD